MYPGGTVAEVSVDVTIRRSQQIGGQGPQRQRNFVVGKDRKGPGC